MTDHPDVLKEPTTVILSEADEQFLRDVCSDREGIINLLDKTQEVCMVCHEIAEMGAEVSPSLETIHQKLHEMVRRKVADGALKIIDVDGTGVMAFADQDEDDLRARVRADMAQAGVYEERLKMPADDRQNAPTTGTVQ